MKRAEQILCRKLHRGDDRLARFHLSEVEQVVDGSGQTPRCFADELQLFFLLWGQIAVGTG
jgi:hypothetical protein